jgi:putative addiction module killer protein
MNTEPHQREVLFYTDGLGRSPFRTFFLSLKDPVTRDRLYKRLHRAARGNFGDHRNLRNGLVELREDYGPGYRVYCGLDGYRFVVVLCGGSKASQRKDIVLSMAYWKEYLNQRDEED